MLQQRAISPWFEVAQLERWLNLNSAAEKPIALVGVNRVPGGNSAETYLLDTISGVNRESRKLVLRRDPVGGPVEREIEREYLVMERLATSPIPVPRVLGLELDPQWLERPFFVDEYRSGTANRNLFNSQEYAPLRPRLGAQFIDLLGALHLLDINECKLDFLPNPGPNPARTEVDCR